MVAGVQPHEGLPVDRDQHVARLMDLGTPRQGNFTDQRQKKIHVGKKNSKHFRTFPAIQDHPRWSGWLVYIPCGPPRPGRVHPDPGGGPRGLGRTCVSHRDSSEPPPAPAGAPGRPWRPARSQISKRCNSALPDPISTILDVLKCPDDLLSDSWRQNILRLAADPRAAGDSRWSEQKDENHVFST